MPNRCQPRTASFLLIDFRMMKLSNRVLRFGEAAEFFTLHEWNFHRDNLNELAKKVKSLKDADNFIVTSEDLDWYSYIGSYLLGIRTFIMNDTPDTEKVARNRLCVCVLQGALKRKTKRQHVFMNILFVSDCIGCIDSPKCSAYSLC